MTVPGKRKFEVGDLVMFDSVSPNVIKNQIGIIVGTEVMSAFQEECFKSYKWYIALFGEMRLIVSDDMIKRL